MQTIDLSHTIRTGMPVFPGDQAPNVRRTHFIKKHGFAQTSLALTTHAGTHVDAAAHLFLEAPGLDELGPDNFTGWGAVLDLTALSTPFIDQPDLAALADIDSLDFALLRTGWDRHWNTERYYRDFPALTQTAARFLAGLGLKGIGLDTPSPDPVDSHDLPAHRILFDHGLTIVENLTRLGDLPSESFLFCCLPLKIADGDASPCRAVGIAL
jgi:kynurenine formamidase